MDSLEVLSICIDGTKYNTFHTGAGVDNTPRTNREPIKLALRNKHAPGITCKGRRTTSTSCWGRGAALRKSGRGQRTRDEGRRSEVRGGGTEDDQRREMERA
ncbi:unnamed protein product [Danaus chrysippus]|uniref:(African queen) hypothetical protein n=1 Tax=Danaus chrysippus TaxID=151541 RepID=A0A8J2QP84_9NEOP|nr:unnamed protein product [Danaus chrysippus]